MNFTHSDVHVYNVSIGIVLAYFCIDLGHKSGVFGSLV